MNLMLMNFKLINLKLIVLLVPCILFYAFLYLWNLIVKKKKSSKNKTVLITSSILLLTLEPSSITQQECFQTTKPLFDDKYEIINRQSVNEKTFPKKIMKHRSDDVLELVHQLAKQELSK